MGGRGLGGWKGGLDKLGGGKLVSLDDFDAGMRFVYVVCVCVCVLTWYCKVYARTLGAALSTYLN